MAAICRGVSLKQSNSDPSIQRRLSVRSLVRQRRVDDDKEEETEEKEELLPQTAIPRTRPGADAICGSSSEQSICLPTLHSSIQSATPIGDFPPPITPDGRTHVLLHNVGRTIQRTGSQLRRTRLFHLFYLLVLPVYTVLGALLFQALDGDHDDRALQEYNVRCQHNRTERLQLLQSECASSGATSCYQSMASLLHDVEACYREWHRVNRTVTYTMSDFSTAVVYAFSLNCVLLSVYTTIGYGNMAADTTGCRVATIFYGAFGIPLFFAFVKEEGNLFRDLFIAAYKHVRRLKRKACKCTDKERSPGMQSSMEHSPLTNGHSNSLGVPSHLDLFSAETGCEKNGTSENGNAPVRTARFGGRKRSASSLLGGTPAANFLNEQRKVFLAGCVVFLWYILSISGLIMLTTDFDYFTSVYFLFNSVALIGFGDVFPKNPRVIILHAVFMILGVVLFSMCYFIMQEEIREKAFEASRKARMSISRYGQTIMAQARSPWSRRNSPLFDGTGGGREVGDGAAAPSNFERLKKRRQSAPAIALTGPGGKTRFREF